MLRKTLAALLAAGALLRRRRPGRAAGLDALRRRLPVRHRPGPARLRQAAPGRSSRSR